jgi:hypothetical protein
MDLTTLHRLADGGLDALPVDHWADLSAWCWDWAEASGDARFCSLARALTAVDEWMSAHGVVPDDVWRNIDRVCREDLPGVLAPSDPTAAAALGRQFRQRVLAQLIPPERW